MAATPTLRDTSHGALLNHLFAGLPADEFADLATELEPVPMRLGEVLHEPGQRQRHAYFPTTAVASLHYVTASGVSAESAGVGPEGMVGISLFMGGDSAPSSALVQTSGQGYRLEHRALLAAFRPFQRQLLRYTHALITQITQTAACYRHHSVEQQLSRWLLTTADRRPAGEFVTTQELAAALLGVRQETVSRAACSLHDAGHIGYRRGHISILDRAGLQTCACECYGVVRKALGRLPPAAVRGAQMAHG